MNDEQVERVFRRIDEAYESNEQGTPLAEALATWGNLRPVVRRGDGKWMMEGFISYLMAVRQIAHAADPSISPELPPQCFDPVWMSEFFGIPLEDFNVPVPPLAATKPGVGQLTEPSFRFIFQHLSPKQQRLYEAASDTEPVTGEELAHKTGFYHDGNTKESLATLVKLGLLYKPVGRRGYLRTPILM